MKNQDGGQKDEYFHDGKMLHHRLIVNSLNSNLSVLSRNPPAADDQIVLIKHRRLAGRDGALRRECNFTFTEPLPVGVTVAGVPGWL